MARWEEALDAVVDIYSLWRSPAGVRIAEGYRRSVLNSDTYRSTTVQHDSLYGPDFGQNMARMALFAEPIYMDPDMMTLAEAAMPTWQEEPLHASDLVTEAGCLLLPRPIVQKDLHDKVVSFRALLWATTVVTLRDPDNKPLMTDDQVERMGGKGNYLPAVIVAAYSMRGDPDGYAETYRGQGVMLPHWSLLHVMPIIFESKHGADKPDVIDKSLYRPMQVIWRLMAQSITVREQASVSKPFRKRAERADVKARQVTVIRLRRPHVEREPGAEPRDVEWTHRWLVSGHWRNQPFPSLGIHRQIWISPYVKGPEDKPLMVRKLRAFEFVR